MRVEGWRFGRAGARGGSDRREAGPTLNGEGDAVGFCDGEEPEVEGLVQGRPAGVNVARRQVRHCLIEQRAVLGTAERVDGDEGVAQWSAESLRRAKLRSPGATALFVAKIRVGKQSGGFGGEVLFVVLEESEKDVEVELAQKVGVGEKVEFSIHVFARNSKTGTGTTAVQAGKIFFAMWRPKTD